MGHNRKTANRAEAIRRNSERFRNLDRRVQDAERENRLRHSELDQRILVLESNLALLRREFDSSRRPWYVKIRDRMKTAPSSEPAPEVIDLDFSDDKPDHLNGRPLDLDYKPIEEDIGQEAEGRAEGEPEADAISDELAGEIEEAGAAIEEAKMEEAKRRLHDPDEIRKRLEARLAAAKAEAVDVFENQELDQEERAHLLDECAERIEDLADRIAGLRRSLGLPELDPLDGNGDSEALENAIRRAKVNRRRHLNHDHGRDQDSAES